MSDVLDARLRGLAERWALPAAAAGQLRTVLELVAVEPVSITTVREPLEGVDVHVADSLVALDVPAVRQAARLADLGSGGGFPGLALAVAVPEAEVALVESVGRKCEFLRRAAEAASLRNVAVVNARAESWREGLGRQDVVTARALAPLSVLVEYAAPLLREGGSLVAWKAGRDPSEERDGVAAAETLGLEPREPLPVAPFDGSGERHLHLYVKVRATPPGYPRRDGMARKRPLRAST
ncbi:MAG TPA: 16S rRNA (guanine(527)-N(7))-methyltransferase RsmG [Baekduia sp.]|nr:16S rRNA (guanine(527)-N(7))-methyltransferase RsmG [Baekduia sp.]